MDLYIDYHLLPSYYHRYLITTIIILYPLLPLHIIIHYQSLAEQDPL